MRTSRAEKSDPGPRPDEGEGGREPVPVDRTAADLARSGRLTPMLRQYLEVKQAHTDCIVLFRLGDFYECFFEDAVTASEILEITLTARGKGEDRFPMAGIPFHAARSYVARLVESGRKVAIADQVEDAAVAKGLVRREVTRILTPGMIVDEEVLDPRTERLLAAVHLGAGDPALALLDLSTGELRAARFDDDDALGAELTRVSPREVLLADDADASRAAHLLARLPGAAPDRVASDLFHPRENRSFLMRHFGVATLGGFGVDDGRGGASVCAAAGAALRHAAHTQKQDAVHVDRLQVYRPEAWLVVDATSRAHLEILRSLQDGGRKGSLLGLLDRTATAMGGRRLVRWLSEPLRDREAIGARQDAVAHLIARQTLREDLHDALRTVADLERLTGRLALGQGNARDLKALARSLASLPDLRNRLREEASGVALLAGLEAGLPGFEELTGLLEGALVDEPPAVLRDGGLFRRGFSAELDELVDLATSGKDWIARFESRERERTGIGSLKVRYNRVFGYYIEITRANLRLVPEDYERRQTTVGAERFVTPELKTYEEKVLSAEDKRKALELRLFEELRERVLARAADLRRAADALATLDVLLALARAAGEGRWSRPVVDDSLDLEIEEGRHPVVEEALRRGGGEPFVPTDVRLSGDRFLHIITGPNMAGKSTAMRMTALVALLAHTGSFVPARRARVGLCDRIFTRVGASDNLARGQSTFMVEMTETAGILNGATGRSLVILDEIGRGTSTYDGVSIAWAVAEHLHDHVRCRTLFATHYHELTDLAKERPGAANFTVAVKEWNGRVVFLRKLVPGAANRSYGIQVARLAGLPPSVLDRAEEVLANLEAGELDDLGHPSLARSREAARRSGQLALFGSAPRRPSELERLLESLDPDGVAPREALDLLYRLKALAAGTDRSGS